MMYEKYKPRAQTFATLPPQFNPSAENPNPPVLHFGLPVTDPILQAYAEWAGELRCLKLNPTFVDPSFVFDAVKVLSEVCNCEFTLVDPYLKISKCHSVVSLYSNYNYKGRQLIEEDEQDVLGMMKAELELADEVQAAWYFDSDDPWRPEYEWMLLLCSGQFDTTC